MSGTAFVGATAYHLASEPGDPPRSFGAQCIDATSYDPETDVKLIVLDTTDGLKILAEDAAGQVEDVTARFFADFNVALKEWFPLHETNWTPEINSMTEIGARRIHTVDHLENYPE